MKVIIEGKIYDSQNTPITLAWDTDEERARTGTNIYTMDPINQPRFFISCPANLGIHEEMDRAQDIYKERVKGPIQMTH